MTRSALLLIPSLCGLLLGGCDTRPRGERIALPDPKPVLRVGGAREVVDIGDLPQTLKAEAAGQARSLADPLATPLLRRLLLHGETVGDLAALLTDLGELNIVASPQVRSIPLYLEMRRLSPRQALDTVCRLHDLWYREDGPVLRLLTAEEYRRELQVRPDERIRIIPLLYAPALGVANAIDDLLGSRIRLIEPRDNSNYGFLTEEDYRGFTNDSDSDSESTFGSRRQGRRGERGGRTTSGQETTTLDDDEQRTALERLGGGRGEGALTTGEAAALGVAPAGVLTVLPRTNALAVASSDEALLRRILGVVEALDTPTPQVLLEVKILSITLGDDFESFFDIAWSKEYSAHEGTETILRGLGQAPLNNPSMAFDLLNRHIDLTVQLLERDNRVESIATPLLLCANNAPATFFVGEQRAILTGIETGETITGQDGSRDIVIPATPTFEYREVGTRLDILPVLNADGTVTLRFDVAIDAAQPSSAPFYYLDGDSELRNVLIDTVSSSTVETIIVTEDGQAIVIGGLIRESTRETIDRVPILGRIPGLGFFFRKQVFAKDKTETVILIRPIVLSNPQQAGWNTRERLRQLGDGSYWREGRERLVEERDGRLQVVRDPVEPPGTGLRAIEGKRRAARNEADEADESELGEPDTVVDEVAP